MPPSRPLSRPPLLALAAVLAVSFGAAAEARGSRHPDSGYGLAAPIEPELYQANVFNGIDSPRVSYDRAHYGSRPCGPRAAAVPGVLVVGGCR